MIIVYGCTINWKYIPTQSQTVDRVATTVAPDSLVLINPSMTSNATLTGYNSGGAATYTKTITPQNSSVIIPLGETRTETTWGISLAVGDKCSGIYVGDSITITDPSYPFAFELSINTTDVETNGGAIYSRQKYKKRSTNLNFTGVTDAEIAAWRAWYASTNGFKDYFVATMPVYNTTHVVASNTKVMPLTKQAPDYWSGSLDIREAPQAW